MSINLTAFKITPTLAALTAGTVQLTAPDNTTSSGISFAAAATKDLACAALVAAINSAPVVCRGKPVKAAYAAGDIYILAVTDPASDTFGPRFGNWTGSGNAGSNVDTKANYTAIVLEDPYVDPTAGYYSAANMGTAMAAVAAMTALIK